MCRKAQVTLIELNREAKEIRARHQNKKQNTPTKTNQPKNTPQTKKTNGQVRISEGLSKPKQKLSENGVRRGF